MRSRTDFVSPAQRRQVSPISRRFAEACTIALATFVSSGIGLLTYLSIEPSPAWLKTMVMASAAAVAVSFIGWVVTSISGLTRN